MKTKQLPKSAWENPRLWYVLLPAFSFLLYANTLFHGYVLDDEIVILNKYVQQGIAGIPRLLTTGYAYGYNGVNEGAYRPLTLIMLALEIAVFGNNVFVHHLINVLLYAAIAMLLFHVLKKLLASYGVYAPVIITLIFIAHPVHTEVAANIKSRDELLNLFFLLLCLNYLILFNGHRKPLHLALSLLFFFMALLSKENAITFLAIIPLTLYFFFNKTVKDAILVTLPFLFIAIVYITMRQSFLTATTSAATGDIINNALAGAKNISEKYATIFYILGKYLLLLIFPYKLSFDYSYKEITVIGWNNPKAIVSFAIAVALLVYAFAGLKKRNIYAYCILFFLLTLSVVLNIFVDIGATMAERFLFLPSIGFCIAFGILFSHIGKTDITGRPATLSLCLLAAVLLLASFKTVKRNSAWKDNLTLFTEDAKTSPLSARAHYNLGIALKASADSLTDTGKKERLLEKALHEFEKTLQIYPAYTEASVKISGIYNMQGLSAGQSGSIDDALRLLHEAIHYDTLNFSAYTNTGVAWLHKGNPDSALYYLHRSLAIKKDNADATANLGVAYGNKGTDYHKSGRLREAIASYKKGLEINPAQLNVINNLRMAYQTLGMKDSANYYQVKAGALQSK